MSEEKRMTEEVAQGDDAVGIPAAQDVSADVVNLTQVPVGNVQAELVRISQGGVESVTAGEVEIRQGGAGGVKAESVYITQGGAGTVKAEAVDVTQGGVGIARAGSMTVVESCMGVAFTDEAALQNSQACLIVSRGVRADKIRTGVLLAGQVEGDVETVFDTPRAMLAGLTAGAAIGLVLWVGQLISGRKE